MILIRLEDSEYFENLNFVLLRSSLKAFNHVRKIPYSKKRDFEHWVMKTLLVIKTKSSLRCDVESLMGFINIFEEFKLNSCKFCVFYKPFFGAHFSRRPLFM